MKNYAVYDKDSGQLISVGTSHVDPLPENLGVSEFETQGWYAGAGWQWNAETLTMEEIIPEPDPIITKVNDLRGKKNLTTAEQQDLIDSLISLLPPQTQQDLEENNVNSSN